MQVPNHDNVVGLKLLLLNAIPVDCRAIRAAEVSKPHAKIINLENAMVPAD